MAGRKKKSAKSKKPSAKRPVRPEASSAAKRHAQGTSRRYSDAERGRILATAQREHLTGAQVRSRFGISTLTFYTWRKRAGMGQEDKGRVGRPALTGSNPTFEEMIRQEVRARLARILPEILESEITNTVTESLRGQQTRSR